MVKEQLIGALREIVGGSNIITHPVKSKYYRSGFRSGRGIALAVVFPSNLIEQWQIIEKCVEANCIIIMQAAKTGLTEGSAPSGEDYDREVVIINIMKIDKIYLLDGGKQVICLPGASLHALEKKLRQVGRAPHSVIGSSSLGATVIGGIANNSGGALVKRGPAYTELALYAQVDKTGQLHLVNHLGINGLGMTPLEILQSVEAGSFDANKVINDQRMASDTEYEARVRDIESDTPSRFNADERRLFEASGCAGKLGVFAVRVDTYPLPEREQIFYLGTNDHTQLTELRKTFLSQHQYLPDMAEYIHRDAFHLSEKYGKDTFLAIEKLGTDRLPRFFSIKARLESFFERVPLINKYWVDCILFYVSKLFPQHLPEKIQQYGCEFEHHLILKMTDEGIEEARQYLQSEWGNTTDGAYFECSSEESKKALLHRFATASAAIRYETIHQSKVEEIVALDVALRRNDDDWLETLPDEVQSNLIMPLYYGHFMCHVFHQDYIFKKGTDTKKMKALMLAHLNTRGAKYPAEHNVGHLYEAENVLQQFYYQLDPTNTFNPGIGKMDRYKRNCNCCE